MDKGYDFRIYSQKEFHLSFQADQLRQRRVLGTRILKLSGGKSESSYRTIGLAFLRFRQPRAIIIDPYNITSQAALTDAFLSLGKENEGFSSIKRSLSIAPHSLELHQFFIETLEEQDKFGNLKSLYQKIAELTCPAYLPSLYISSAKVLTQLNHYPQAFSMYQKVIEADPTILEHYFDYGMALYHEGLFQEAMVQFEHTKRLDPEHMLAFSNCAFMKYSLGKIDEAFEDFQYLIENNLMRVLAYPNVILILHHLDKSEEEINKYKDILRPRLGGCGDMLRKSFKEALRITQVVLQKNDIDEETKEFNLKKLNAINSVLSFLN